MGRGRNNSAHDEDEMFEESGKENDTSFHDFSLNEQQHLK
jgi:hypothetical protein